jgi:hypothetical protein
VPTVAFDVGSTRTIAHRTRGLLHEPALIKVFLWGSPAIGPNRASKPSICTAPDPEHLDVEWLVVPYGIADPAGRADRAALERGAYASASATARLRSPTCRTPLAERARRGKRSGRPVASPDDVRERFGTSGSTHWLVTHDHPSDRLSCGHRLGAAGRSNATSRSTIGRMSPAEQRGSSACSRSPSACAES